LRNDPFSEHHCLGIWEGRKCPKVTRKQETEESRRRQTRSRRRQAESRRGNRLHPGPGFGRKGQAKEGLTSLFGITDLAGFVDVLAGEAEIGGCGPHVLIWNMRRVSPLTRNFSPFLRRVVFVGQPALGQGLDFEGVLAEIERHTRGTCRLNEAAKEAAPLPLTHSPLAKHPALHAKCPREGIEVPKHKFADRAPHNRGQ
jgi:hypothetical protein